MAPANSYIFIECKDPGIPAAQSELPFSWWFRFFLFGLSILHFRKLHQFDINCEIIIHQNDINEKITCETLPKSKPPTKKNKDFFYVFPIFSFLFSFQSRNKKTTSTQEDD